MGVCHVFLKFSVQNSFKSLIWNGLQCNPTLLWITLLKTGSSPAGGLENQGFCWNASKKSKD